MINREYGIGRVRAGTRAFLLSAVSLVLLLLTVAANQRNYNDPWILDGILIPTLMFIFLFFMVVAFVRSNQKAALLTGSFLAVLNLVVGFKYPQFYNTYDSTFHFRFTNELKTSGHVPQIGGASEYYASNPAMHILMSSLSVVSAIPVNEIFRFVMPAMAGLIPLIVYFITKDLLAEDLQRYCIIASAFPINAAYTIYGTGMSIGLYFLLFAVLLREVLVREQHIEYTAIFITLSFALIVAHPVTPLLVLLLLVGMPLSLKMLHALSAARFPRFPTAAYTTPAFMHLVMLMTWWTNLATANLTAFVHYIERVFSPTAFMEIPIVPTRFFEVPLWARINVFLVYNVRYVIVAALSLLGLLIFLRSLEREELKARTKRFYLHMLVLVGIVGAYLLFTVGYGLAVLEYQRFMIYLMPFAIFFFGLLFWRLSTFRLNASSRMGLRNSAVALLLFVFFSLTLIQFFRYQPLVPTASVLGTELSGTDYLVDVNLVNTVYQIRMISFAETHSSIARTASDGATRWQVRGFSNASFSSRHIYFSPLEPNPDRIVEWDLLLLHTRKAGPFNEQVEYRSVERIENLRTQAGNLIYDNGASFILSNFLNSSKQPTQD